MEQLLDEDYADKLQRQLNQKVAVDKNNIVDTFSSKIEKKGAIELKLNQAVER